MIGIELGHPAVTMRRANPLPLLIDVIENRYERGGETASSFASLAGVSFSRSGAGTAVTTAGVVTAFATGVARITDRGLLLEPAATNLLRHSTALLNPVWQADAGATAALGPDADPSGSAGAVRLTLNGGLKQWYQLVTAPAGNYVLSAYVKAASGTTNVRLNETHNTGYTPSANLAVNTQWQRLVFPFTVTATLVTISFMTALGGVTSPIDAWGVQLETGSGPTSPIITAGSTVTRGADLASIVVPGGASTYEAIYGAANTFVTGAVTPGASFDLVAARPWVGVGNELKRLVMR
ncbi:phage head spike fiber domain-containing protein [Brevundimonas sp.]|uniref:phage head spike fiber domain-containing protein n=1 Tax=Brevundimonas sp. TaxID=1871086 RepID=UPI003D09C0AB